MSKIEIQAQPVVRSRVLMPALVFSVLVGFTLALFLFPALIIQPFKYQSPRGIALAMAVRQVAPLWSLASLAAALLFAVMLWGRIGRWTRPLLVLGIVLASAATVMSRIDYFEWMFHPAGTPGFRSADQAQLAPSEMVMAVNLNGDARAYPILEMAYHHIVNDTVGDVPIVVTY